MVVINNVGRIVSGTHKFSRITQLLSSYFGFL